MISYLLAFGFIIWQASILVKMNAAKEQIIKKKISSLDFINSLSTYKDEQNPNETESNWLNTIHHMLGRNASINEIKDILHSHFDQELNMIRTYSNQGPALGVLSTFLGMAIVLLSSGSSDISNNLSGLAPMISGSVLGIIVYYRGNLFLSSLNNQISEVTGSYLNEFFIFEKEHNISKIQNLEGVYQKLLQPMTEILDTFKKIKTNFTKFDNSYGQHIKTFGEMINQQAEGNKDYLSSLSQSFNEHLTNLNSGLSLYFDKSNQHLEAINITIEQLKNFKETIDILQNQFTSSLEQLETFIGSTDGVQAIVNSLGESIGSILQVSTSIDRISGEFNGQNENITTLAKAYDSYTIEVQKNFTEISGFKNSVNSLDNHISIPLANIGENIKNFPTQDLVSLTKQIDIIKESILESNKNSIISKNDRHIEVENILKEIAEIKDVVLSNNNETNKKKHDIKIDLDYSKLAEALNQQMTISKPKSKIAKLKNFSYQFTIMTTAIVISAILMIGTANYFDWVLK